MPDLDAVVAFLHWPAHCGIAHRPALGLQVGGQSIRAGRHGRRARAQDHLFRDDLAR